MASRTAAKIPHRQCTAMPSSIMPSIKAWTEDPPRLGAAHGPGLNRLRSQARASRGWASLAPAASRWPLPEDAYPIKNATVIIEGGHQSSVTVSVQSPSSSVALVVTGPAKENFFTSHLTQLCNVFGLGPMTLGASDCCVVTGSLLTPGYLSKQKILLWVEYC